MEELEKKIPARPHDNSGAGGKNVVVETFAADMADALRNDKEGLVKKIIKGVEESEEENKNLSPESKKNRLFMIISIALCLCGVAVLSFFLLTGGAKTVLVERQFVPLIFHDRSSFIEVSEFKKSEIEQIVLNQANKTEVKKGRIEGIYLTLNNKKIG